MRMAGGWIEKLGIGVYWAKEFIHETIWLQGLHLLGSRFKQ